MYSLIMGSLPYSVEIDGMTYNINWRYRDMAQIEIILFSEEQPEEKIRKALSIFYGDFIPQNIDGAIEKMLWFFYCGKENKKSNEKKGARQKRRAYDLTVDSPYIYAAFREQYGVNLMTDFNLHWWEFSAMFECLNESTKMSRIIYYRTADTKGLPDKQRKFINEMRAMYEIKKPQSNLSDEAKLAKRNADMKAYVERRMNECPQIE